LTRVASEKRAHQFSFAQNSLQQGPMCWTCCVESREIEKAPDLGARLSPQSGALALDGAPNPCGEPRVTGVRNERRSVQLLRPIITNYGF